MAIGTNYNADQAKNSLKDPVNGKRQQALDQVFAQGLTLRQQRGISTGSGGINADMAFDMAPFFNVLAYDQR